MVTVPKEESVSERQLFKEAKSLLSCFTCGSKLIRKFFICEKGHGICVSCRKVDSRFKTICLCRSKYINDYEKDEYRCVLLENVSESVWNEEPIETILRLMECHVCYNRLHPMPVLCKRGHSVCIACRTSIQECPTCKADFPERQNNLYLMSLLKVFPVRCKYKENGCSYLDLYHKVLLHELKCAYKEYDCKIKNCQFTGGKRELMFHVRNSHNNCFHVSNSIEIKAAILSPTSEIETIYLVKYDKKLFWHFYKFINAGLYFGIQILNDLCTAENYTAVVKYDSYVVTCKIVDENCLDTIDPSGNFEGIAEGRLTRGSLRVDSGRVLIESIFIQTIDMNLTHERLYNVSLFRKNNIDGNQQDQSSQTLQGNGLMAFLKDYVFNLKTFTQVVIVLITLFLLKKPNMITSRIQLNYNLYFVKKSLLPASFQQQQTLINEFGWKPIQRV